MNGSSQLFGTNKGLPEFGLRTQGHHAAIQHVQGRQRRLLMRVHMQTPLAGDPTNLRLAKAILIPAMANRAI